MSRIRADKISNKAGTGAVQLQYGAEVPVGYGITGAGTINVTGVITAASFAGSGANLTGIDATSIKDSGGNVKIQAQSSGAMYTGIHTFLGNVSVGGTLTYEDVTNVDAVGLITARNGINVSGGTATFADDATFNGATTNMVWDKSDSKLKFNNILNIYNKDGSSRIDSASGGMFFKATGAYVWSNNSLSTRFEALDSSCLLYANGAKIARSSTSGFQVGNPDGGVGIAVTIGIDGNAVFGGTGIVTATTYHGDGSNLTGISVGPGTGESYVKLRTNTAASNSGNNTFAGYLAGNSLGSNSGDHNTFYGINAGAANDGGQNNVFLGSNAGSVNVGGHENVAIGQAAYSNGTGDKNIAIGRRALKVTTSSDSSVGIGFEALMAQTNGGQSVAIGHQAALTVETGSQNVAIGHNALKLATSSSNTIVGAFAGDAIVGGSGNVALGRNALSALQSGSNCIAIGRDAAASSTSVSNEVTIGDGNISSFRIPGISYTATSQTLTYGGDISLSEGKKTIFGSNSGSGAYIKHQSGHFELKNQTGNFYFDNVGALHFRTGASYTTALTINPNQSCTFTAGVNIGPGVLAEKSHVDSGGGITGTYNHDVLTYGMVWYGSSNAAGTWTFNVRGNGSTSFDSLMSTGETTTMTMIAGNNNAANYMTAFQIQGVTQTVEWAGGTAPSAGTGSGYDSYVVTIIKLGSNSYKCFGNFTNFN